MQSDFGQALERIDRRYTTMAMTVNQTLEDMRSELRRTVRSNEQQVQTTLKASETLDSYSAAESHNLPDADLEDLSHHVKYLKNLISLLIPQARFVISQQSFLASLYFKAIKARQDTIDEAHSKTFRWVFSSQLEGMRRPILFSSWLRKGNGIFWVRGKAGSGKSTLMKFISQHERTQTLLQEWAGNKKIITASHFFWCAGSKLQKSQDGLARTLLFEILRRCPEAIPNVRKNLGHITSDDHTWSTSEIHSAFKSLTDQALSLRFCFFVDGLDEYEGNQNKLIDTLQCLTKSSDIKLCVSSRPWTCFLDAFGQDPDCILQLEYLTFGDIRSFVHESFQKHRQFGVFADDPRYAKLIQDVIDGAQGVFLWVILVVKSLLNGFTYGDRISDLQRRLDALPRDLEDFFKHMLESVDPFYQKQSSQTFLLAINFPEALPLMIYSIIDDIDEDLSTFTSPSLHQLNESEIRLKLGQMTRRLDGRSRGLLEVRKDHRNAWGPLLHRRVEFLHRTVRDFLHTNDIRDLLTETAGREFDPVLAFYRSFSVLVECNVLLNAKRSDVEDALPDELLEAYLHFMWRMESEKGTDVSEPLQNFEWVLRDTYPEWRWYGSRRTFFSVAAERNLHSYVASRLSQDPNLLSSSRIDGPLLHIALRPSEPPYRPRRVCAKIVRLLLDLGAKPGEAIRNTATVWGTFMFAVELLDPHDWESQLGLDYVEAKEVVEMLVAKRADLQEVINDRLYRDKSIFRERTMLADNRRTLMSAEQIIKHRFNAKDCESIFMAPPGVADIWRNIPFAWPFYSK
jgi:hypothetical protein